MKADILIGERIVLKWFKTVVRLSCLLHHIPEMKLNTEDEIIDYQVIEIHKGEGHLNFVDVIWKTTEKFIGRLQTREPP